MKQNPAEHPANVQLQIALICACKSSKVLSNVISTFGGFDPEWGAKTYEWITSSLKATFEWMQQKNMRGKFFEENFLNLCVDFLGYYYDEHQPKEYHALNCCYHAIALFCLAMIEHDKLIELCPERYYPSVLQEYPNRLNECLQSAQQASSNPEEERLWQESVIARLLHDHYTDNPDELGAPISREYLEDLLGEKLPF